MNSLKKNMVIAGGSGLVGRHFVSGIDLQQYNVYVLTRTKKPVKAGINYIVWDPSKLYIDPFLPDADIIINLAGEGIADQRWTSNRKIQLLESRTQSAKTLVHWIKTKHFRPSLCISASAVGYYGHRGDELLTESSSPGNEFMSDICLQWEKANCELKELTDRFVLLRIGIVLSKYGGALPKLMMTKNFGFLAYFGDGRQYYPWIHIRDLSGIMTEIIRNNSMSGVFNAVAPQEISNKECMVSVQQKLKNIFLILPVPSVFLKVALGSMSKVVLNSNRVIPQRLLEAGFRFLFTDFGLAVKDVTEGNENAF
jgi:uncharacterized protein (TIGR01777 family)